LALPLALFAVASSGIAARGDVIGQASAAAPSLGAVSADQTPRYDVGADYHAYGTDFLHTAFITIYDRPGVRQTVQAQLQGMADHGATTISTRIWLVTEPGTTDFGETWRATFPMTDREAGNLRNYAADVAAVRGIAGNRLRLDVCLLWLGAADYTMGSPSSGLGYFSISGAQFTSRLQTTTDKVLAAVSGVTRPDGVPVVNLIYLNGEVMIGYKANEDWFMTTQYPRFVSVVTRAGFTPAVYFIVADTQDHVLQDDYVDSDYPILNDHRSMFFVYRTMRFMVDHGLPLPGRIDFSYYVPSSGASYPDLLTRVLDDADATLPSLGASPSYAAAETFYFRDAAQRHAHGQAFADEAVARDRLKSVTFWTTPDGGGAGVNVAYPFVIEDYLPPPPPPVIDTFVAKPVLVGLGSPSQVSWSTAGASTVRLDGVAVAVAGSRTVSPGSTTTYTLAATNAGGTVSRAATVSVDDGLAALGPPIVTAPTPGQSLGGPLVAFGWTSVGGASGYDLRVLDDSTGAALFSGTVATTAAQIGLPEGSFRFAVRACSAFAPANCGPYGSVAFAVSPGRAFYTLAPCRLLDTRNVAGADAAAPALAGGSTRLFKLLGRCALPASAKAVSVNLTVTDAAAQGFLTLFAADAASLPFASHINFVPGLTRANNALVRLSSSGEIKVRNGAAGAVHFILDVSGWYE
jgi:hypothetical protein